MKNKGTAVRNRALFSAYAFIIALLLVSTCALIASKADVSAKRFVSEYFTYSDATSAEAATGESGRKGLLVKGLSFGSSVQTKDVMSGRLDLDFSLENGLKGFRLKITDVNNPRNGFDAIVSSDGDSLGVCVEAFGKKAGISYTGKKPNGRTATNCASGVYTSVAAEKNGNILSFDPSSGCVYVSDADGEKTVWNFSYSENDGFGIGGTLDAVSEYKTSIVFDRSSGESDLLVYAINGQKFDTPFLYGKVVDKAAPRIFADVLSSGVSGTPYIIPAPRVYDVADGVISKATVEITRDGVCVMPETVYADGMRFTPYSTGSYVLRYSAVDSNGNKAAEEFLWKVTKKDEPCIAEYSTAALPSEIGKGSSVIIPECKISSLLFMRGERKVSARLTVKRDGETVENYDGVFAGENETFTFDETGEYTFIYASANSGLAFSDAFTVKATDGIPSVNAFDLAARYEKGETVSFDLPEMTFGGESKTAAPVLTYPSGAVYGGSKHVLSEVGRYELTLGASFGDKEYSLTREFFVKEKAYSVQSGDFASYGNTEYLTDAEGIKVSLSRDGVFRYNKVIDISNLTKDDRLLEMYMTPKTQGVAEAYGLEVRITDAHDPTNYVTVLSCREAGNDMSYMRAAAVGQPFAGYRGATPNDFDTLDIGNDDEGGRIIFLSPKGNVTAPNKEIMPFEIYYDYENKQVHVGKSSWAGWNNRMVCDLDDAKIFRNPWTRGFTTGEVLISVRASVPMKDKVNFIITDIYGENVNNALIGSGAPSISADVSGYDENDLPQAVAGREYPVFAASADLAGYGEIPVSVSAVFGYGSSEPVYFDITDGKFTPPFSGEYTLVYTAKNFDGEKAVKRLTFRAVREIEELSVTVDSSASAIAGKTCELPICSTGGGSGRKTIEITYVAPSGAVGEIESGEFIPTETGTYVLTYKATDYLGTEKTATCSLSVTDGGLITADDPVFPVGFVSGTPYKLPEMYATDYSSGGERVKAEPSVECGGVSLEITDGAFTPVADSGAIVKITYKARGTVLKSYEIPVIKIKETVDGEKKFYMNEYFVSSNMSAVATEPDENGGAHGVVLTALENDAVSEYLLPLVAGTFKIEFDAMAESGLSAAGIMLSDAENPDIAVAFMLSKGINEYEKTILTVGDDVYKIKGSFYDVANGRFTLSYEAAAKCLYDGSTTRAYPTETIGGEAFDGFPSGKVRMKLYIGEKDGAIAVRYLCGQRMSLKTTDAVEPKIYVAEPETKVYSVGSEISVPAAYTADVLDDEIKFFTVSVKLPDGQFASDSSGNKLQNVPVGENKTFVLSQAGNYVISYNASDGSDNIGTAPYNIRAVDTTASVITLSSETIGDVKTGEKVSLPEATVTGAKNDAVYIYVYRPDGKAIIPESASYSDTSQKGRYTVRYVAFAECGVMTVKTITFNAE